MDGYNNIWVVDNDTNNANSGVPNGCNGACYRLEVFDDNGNFLHNYAMGTWPYGDGNMNYPTGIAVDVNNNIWVASYNISSLMEYSNGGVYLQTLTNGVGSGSGQFDMLVWLSFDPSGNIWATDSNPSNRVQQLSNSFVWKQSIATVNGTPVNTPYGIAVSR